MVFDIFWSGKVFDHVGSIGNMLAIKFCSCEIAESVIRVICMT